MSKSVSKNVVTNQELESKLLSTLDEFVFFKELAGALKHTVDSDLIEIHQVFDDLSTRQITSGGKTLKNSKRMEKGESSAAQVVSTRRAYISNNVHRDPIFNQVKNLDEKYNCELIVPAMSEGGIVCTIHFKRKDIENGFDRKDINDVVAVLNEIQVPLSNMRMFLAAKFLNDSLLRKIQETEKEMISTAGIMSSVENIKVQEPKLISNSAVMTTMIEQLDKAAASEANILIVGESGTGKEMLAKRTHCKSKRFEKSFSILDCSILNEAQLEKEIFGEETNDINRPIIRHGLLESCNNGTLVINNIASMSLRIQGLLNTFLEEGMSFRKGGQVPYRSNVRILTISTKNLDELAQEGKFKLELLLKLNTIKVNVPALRDRGEDIIKLANHFLNDGKNFEMQKSLSPGAVKKLKEYSWPSNVRELENVIERAYILSDGMIVDSSHLADFVVSNISEQKSVLVEEDVENFREMTLDELEKAHICKTLEHLGGNKTKTAKILGITVKTLYNKLHSYDMIATKE